MAVAAALISQRRGSRRLDFQQQLRQEASMLMSVEAIGTRLSQIDRIIKRKAANVLFTLDTAVDEEHIPSAKRSTRLEHLAQEFLFRVQGRRKRARSYFYLSWFLLFAGAFVISQFMKEDNANLFTVDISIKTRIVDILPTGHLNADSDFFNWLSATIQDIFQPTICGNGSCEGPEEYAGIGRFGCQMDCGHQPNRTSIRIDLLPIWDASSDLAPFKDKWNIGSDGNLQVGFSYNIYSDTLQDYMLKNNSMLRTNVMEVPDGTFRLELYQNVLVTSEMSPSIIGEYTRIDPNSLPAHDIMLPDFQYGDPAEVFGTAAALTFQLHEFCQFNKVRYPMLCANITRGSISDWGRNFLDNYGVSGSIRLLHGDERVLVKVPFCKVSKSSQNVYAEATKKCRSALGDGLVDCFDAQVLMRNFTCQASFDFSVWSWGPPRSVNVKSTAKAPPRKITPFNNLIGGLIMTQNRRKTSRCPVDPAPLTQALVSQFQCQTRVRSLEPFGMDPTFVAGSDHFAGQLAVAAYYAENEIRNTSMPMDLKRARIPYGFFAHEWGIGKLKSPELIHAKDIGTYKVYWDTRLSSTRALKLVDFLQAGAFMDDLTDTIELELVTYNPEYAVFGVATFQFVWDLGGNIQWDYQYNTVQMSPYLGRTGQLRLAIDVIFGFMLLVDMMREGKDIFDSFRRDQFFTHYLKSFFKYLNWTHYILIIISLATWTEFNTLSSSLVLKSSYPVLADLESRARPFLTYPEGEFELLSFVDKLRNLSEIKNRYLAYNVLTTLMFIGRLLKILDFQPRMALITRTLRQAGVDLVHFLLLFGIVIFGYAVIATLLLGGQLKEFNNMEASISTLFFVFLGWEPKYGPMLAAVQTKRSPFAVLAFQLFYWSYIVIATFVLLNVVLAIIVEAYAAVKRKNENCQTMAADIVEIAGDSGRRIYNRLFESELLISDKKLEKVLIEASQKKGLKLRKKKKKEKGPNALRLPGGLQLTAKDLSILLKCGGVKADTLFKRMTAKSQQGEMHSSHPLSGSDSECVDADMEEEIIIPRPIQDVINRYEQRVDEAKEEHDFLRLLKAEGLKRQIALTSFMDDMKQQIDNLNVTMSVIASSLLSDEEKTKLLYDKLVTAAKSNKLDRSIDIGELFKLSDTLCGELKITVVAARQLQSALCIEVPTPYCVIFLKDETVGEGDPEVLARTPTSTSSESDDNKWESGSVGQNVWNASYSLCIEAHKGSRLLFAVLEDAANRQQDDNIYGVAMIPLAQTRLGEESDKWYRLHQLPANDASEAMLRIKLKFTAHHKTRMDCLPGFDEDLDQDEMLAQKSALQEEMHPVQGRIKQISAAFEEHSRTPSVHSRKNDHDADSLRSIRIEADSEATNPAATKEVPSHNACEISDVEISRIPQARTSQTTRPAHVRKRLYSVGETSDQLDPVVASFATDPQQEPEIEPAPRKSVHLDANQAFAFRSNIRARLELLRRLTRELGPVLGEHSYRNEPL